MRCEAWPVGLDGSGPRLTHQPQRACPEPAGYAVTLARHDPARVTLCEAHTAEVRRVYAGRIIRAYSIRKSL